MTGARIGYGSIFRLWDFQSSPPGLVQLDEPINITPPSETTDVIDGTHMQSPDRTREFTQGLIDPGEASVEFNFIPGNATDLLIRRTRLLSGNQNVPAAAKIEFPNGVTYDFDVIITGWEPTTPLDDKMTATLSMKVTSVIDTGVTT